jgi:hypothetical protein
MVSRLYELSNDLASCVFLQMSFHSGHIYRVYHQCVILHVFWVGLLLKVSHVCELLNVFSTHLTEKMTLDTVDNNAVSRQCELLNDLSSFSLVQMLFHIGYTDRV